MTQAFKCDRCGDFQEGSPNRRKYHKYLSSNAFGWTGKEVVAKVKLCGECAEKADETIESFLNGNND